MLIEAVLETWNQATVIMVQDLVVDPQDLRGLFGFCPAAFLQLGRGLLVMTRIAIGHGDEGDLVAAVTPERAAASCVNVTIVRVSADDEDLFHVDLDTVVKAFKNKAAMIPVDRFEPAPLYQPGSYPGASPAESFLFLGDTIELLDKELDPGSLDRKLVERGSKGLGERHAVLCSGSNACPAQVRVKVERIAKAHPAV